MNAQNTAMGWLALGLATLGISISAQAQPKKAAPAEAKPAVVNGNDKVDISDLENKYWAPKDTDFTVVQNRTYSKTKKISLTPQWGRLINDPYSDGNLYGLTANYFWSERMGVQFNWYRANLHNNQNVADLATLASTTGAAPNHGKTSSYYGVGYTVVPFYAKMSFWTKKIIYFDMAFTPHIGLTEYEQQVESGNKSKSAFTYGIDITQYFFFSRWLAIRADLRNQWRSEEILKYRGAGMGDKVKDKVQQDTMFFVGPMFYF